MSDSTGEATSPDTRDLSLQWHEVVHSEQFSEPVKRPTSPGWTWRYTWIVLRYSVMPMLVTAVALTTVLLTLIGLVARPFPWSPQPLFGGGLGHSHVVSHPSPTPTPTRTGAAAAPSGATNTGPADVASPAGTGSRALATAAGPTGPVPSGPPTPGIGATVGAGLPPLPLLSGVLPSVTLSVGVSLPVPTSILPVPLPPLAVTVPPLPLPVPLPKLSVGVVP
jgi:hypothetical protein